MRFRLRPLTVLVFSVPTALMGVLAACGGGDTTTDAGSDATLDVAKDNAVADVAKDNAVVDAGCDAPDLSTLLGDGGVPDANVDGGANLTCALQCAMEPADAGGCGTQTAACNADCWCRQDIIDLGICVAQTQDLQGCAFTAISSGNANVINLLSCLQSKCLAKCLGGGDAGGDSGPKDAGDGG